MIMPMENEHSKNDLILKLTSNSSYSLCTCWLALGSFYALPMEHQPELCKGCLSVRVEKGQTTLPPSTKLLKTQ